MDRSEAGFLLVLKDVKLQAFPSDLGKYTTENPSYMLECRLPFLSRRELHSLGFARRNTRADY